MQFRKRVTIANRFNEVFKRNGPVVFEGAQGVLLDENLGFHPHTTWSTTTLRNVYILLRGLPLTFPLNVRKIGVMRAYMTRHGAGPFVTEDPALIFRLPEQHNPHGQYQQGMRAGHLDLVALDYALNCNAHGVDEIAVTHLDRAVDIKVCKTYDVSGCSADYFNSRPGHNGMPTTRLLPGDLKRQAVLAEQLFKAKPIYAGSSGGDAIADLIAYHTGLPVKIRSYGPTYKDKQENR